MERLYCCSGLPVLSRSRIEELDLLVGEQVAARLPLHKKEGPIGALLHKSYDWDRESVVVIAAGLTLRNVDRAGATVVEPLQVPR